MGMSTIAVGKWNISVLLESIAQLPGQLDFWSKVQRKEKLEPTIFSYRHFSFKGSRRNSDNLSMFA